MTRSPYYPLGGFQFFRKVEPLSVTEATRRAECLRSSVLSRWNTLNAIVLRHEGTIRKRWQKKTGQKREKLLLEAWPEMPKTHRPDLQALHEVGFYHARHNYERLRNSFYWPYLNLEDLREAEPLLLLMQSRSMNKPRTFALLDMDPMFIVTVLAPTFYQPTIKQTHGMNLIGVTSDDGYGVVTRLENSPESITKPTEVSLSCGIKILEIQDWILEFLARCCYGILHDMDISSLLGDDFPIQTVAATSIIQPILVTSHVKRIEQLPYRLPGPVDLDSLENSFLAKIDSARDHIWALREDPSYFEFVIRHCQESSLLFSPEVVHAMPDQLRENPFSEFTWVPHRVIAQAYRALHVWCELHDIVTELKSHPELFSETMYIREDEPVGSQAVVFLFAHRLQAYAQTLTKRLLESGVLDRVTSLTRAQRSPNQSRHQPRSRNEPPELGLCDIVEQAMGYTYNHRVQGWRDMQIIFEALKKLHESSGLPTCIQGLLSTTLDDLALVLETLHEIHLSEVWVRIMAREWEIQEPHGSFEQLHGSMKTCNLAGLWDPCDGRFKYLTGRPTSEKVVNSMRTAEKNLDDFWRAFDQHCLSTLGKTTHDLFREEIGPERALERTAKWDCTTMNGSELPTQSHNQSLLYLPYEVPNIVEASQEVKPRSRAKVKTKGASDTVGDLKQEDLRIQPNVEQQPRKLRYLVSKRGIKVFSTLFHNVADEERPRETSWTSFVHAMVSIGFAAEKRYGSVWCFKPRDEDGQKSIEIHEPHNGKITYLVGRRIGRRLNRAYGWNGDTFARASKEPVTDDVVKESA